MKQLSARKFRLSFPSLSEPVLVMTYIDGEYRQLGTWTPTKADPTILRDAVTAVVTRPAAQRFDDGRSGFGHSSPAPRPSQKKR